MVVDSDGWVDIPLFLVAFVMRAGPEPPRRGGSILGSLSDSVTVGGRARAWPRTPFVWGDPLGAEGALRYGSRH